jgi:hypothetical protein
VSLGFVAFCGVGALWIVYESWADWKKRNAFQAERIDDAWKSFGFAGVQAYLGERLAETVRSCIARNGPPSSADAVVAGDCSSLRHHRIDAPAPRRPPLPHEDGWRWKYVDDASGWRVVVAPHPDLTLPGPIFEVDRNLRIMRRNDADSPAYAVWAGLVVATRYRECLLSAQSQSQALGTWKGDWQMLPSTVAETTGCSSVTAVDVARVRPGRWLLKLKAVDVEAIPDPVDVTYDIAAYGFTLRTAYGGAHYLLDVSGGWHKTREPRGANLEDPAPPACEIDLAMPCTE